MGIFTVQRGRNPIPSFLPTFAGEVAGYTRGIFWLFPMGGTRIFESGGSEGARQRAWGKRKLLLSDCVLTHFVDFYITFTLQQCTGRVERARIIFSHDDWGAGVTVLDS